jgi:ornithine cyclodeaminase
VSILILNHHEVDRLLPVEECIPIMAEALGALARGEVHMPLRTVVRPPQASGLLGLMPSYASGPEKAYGLKAVCVFPQNAALGKDAHQGGVLLFNGETGELLAVLNASAITAIRTAAVSGVATRLLAREDAGELALVGSGVQARAHLPAMAAVRPLRRVRVASRSYERAREFASEFQSRYPFPIEPAGSVEAAVAGADLVVTVTTSREPIVKRDWLSPGTHLNVVGSSIPTTREVDTATMAASCLFVDRRESTLNEAGDYLFAAREGAIGPEDLQAELGEILIGTHPGRRSAEEITLFKSLGLAVEDLAAARYLYQKARQLGEGSWVEF